MPRPDPDTAGILLAAGRSQRFGGNKLVSLYRGRPLWRWAADALEEAGFARLYIVVGAGSMIDVPRGWAKVENPDAAQGMGTSIAAGVSAARDHRRIVIALSDMPMMTATHLRRIAAGEGPTFTMQHDGRAGPPAGFGPESFARLETLEGERGARYLDHPGSSTVRPDDPRVLFDVDTREDLRVLHT